MYVCCNKPYAGGGDKLDREVKKCLVEAFRKTDEQFLKQASVASPSWKVRMHCSTAGALLL